MVKFGNGKVSYSTSEAKEVIAGYAFGKIPLQWKSRRSIPAWAGGPAPSGLHRYLFSYMTYDNIPPAKGPLTVGEVLLTAGIESQISSRGANAIMAISSLIDPDLNALANAVKFWKMRVTLLDREPTAVGNNPEYHLWRAWRIMKEPKWSGPAVAHKVLHHRLPSHVPLVDQKVVDIYGDKSTWTGIWHDLNDNEEFFVDLEKWFRNLANQMGHINGTTYVSLSRLRLIDILLWTDGTKDRDGISNRDVACGLGRALLRPLP